MKTTQFRIKLFDGSTSLADTIALLAAKSNGGKSYTIAQLKGVFEAECLLYPSLNGGCQAELIGENMLHIDRKIGEDVKTICEIEQVEIWEVPAPVEESETDPNDLKNVL